MKALILAAGYATRLYPLTENFPKPLLKVQQVSIIDRLLSSLEEISFIDEYIVVSNHKFFQHFVNWKNEAEQKKLYEKTITLLDDGSIDNEHRLGAVQAHMQIADRVNLHSRFPPENFKFYFNTFCSILQAI